MSDKVNVFVDGEVLKSDSSTSDSEAEITGKINEFLRLMMDNNVQNIDSEKFADMAMYLADRYNNNYRHSYYNISAEIYAHWKAAGRNEEKLSNLADNVEKLKNIILEHSHKNDDLVKKGVRKFYDHIMLEHVRLTDQQKCFDSLNKIISEFDSESKLLYEKLDISLAQTVAEFENRFGEAEEVIGNQREITNKAGEEIKNVQENIKKVESETNKIQNDIGKTKKKVKNIYSQFVSILGIFTAIVIVFFGGASIFSDVLTNIHEAEWYQIGFGVAFVGLVLFDIIFMFLYVLSKFLEIPIHTRESYGKKFFIIKWIDKYPYVFVFNLLCIAIMIVCA